VKTPDRALRAACALLGLLSVGSLLAWLWGLGSFALYWWAVSVPATLVLVAAGVRVSWRWQTSAFRTALIAGVLGGLAGTVAYDAVRLPETLFGIRPYMPIESYGLLMLNAGASSPLTDYAGWIYNFSNGIGFGVAYAMFATGRRWWYAIGWAMVLESMTLISPWAAMFLIAGKWDLIGLAYAAHVFYAIPLGLIVQSADSFVREVDAFSRWTAPAALAALCIGLGVWLRPWPAQLVSAGSPRPAARIVADRFQPKWLRVPLGGCVTFINADPVARVLHGVQTAALPPGGQASACFSTPGVVRIPTSQAPDAGGLILVDPALPRGRR